MPGISLLDGLAAQMKYLNQRQQVVAENIANNDTAGYRSRDLGAPDFSKVLGDVGDGKIAKPSVGATERMAALGSHVSIGGAHEFKIKNSEEKPNGNNVVVEDELLKMGSIKQDYTAASSLYKKSLGLLKIVTTGKE